MICGRDLRRNSIECNPALTCHPRTLELTILKKRDNYRKAFDQFDPAVVAKYDKKKQARLLKNAGIVVDEKRGTMVFYRLRVKCLTSFFGCVESVLKSNAREQGLLVNLS